MIYVGSGSEGESKGTTPNHSDDEHSDADTP